MAGCIAVLISRAVLLDVEDDDVGGDDREVWDFILIHFPARRDCGVLLDVERGDCGLLTLLGLGT